MRAHRVVDELEQRRAVVAAPFFVILWLKAPEIRDEVGLPDASALDLRNVAAAFAPLVGATVIAIAEDEVVVKNVIEVAITVDNHRRVAQRDHSDRSLSLRIEMLMPGVERRRKEAALLPFQGVLFAALVP